MNKLTSMIPIDAAMMATERYLKNTTITTTDRILKSELVRIIKETLIAVKIFSFVVLLVEMKERYLSRTLTVMARVDVEMENH